jgi:Pretoxin HINT domain
LLARGYYPVLRTFKHKSDEVLHLRFTNGDRIGTTAPHPFWSLDRNGWLAAEKLHKGERVKTAGGETAVDTMWLVFGAAEVWNLEVKGAHSYCVGKGGEVVHNECNFFIKTWKQAVDGVDLFYWGI